jgi:hypothetical protein
MKSINCLFLLVLLFATPVAAQTNLVFNGYHTIRDTTGLFQQPGNGSYYDAVDTVIINVPLNQVWFVSQSIFSQDFSNGGAMFSLNQDYCNCIKLDGIILHNAFNSEYYNVFNGNPLIVVPKNGSSNSLRSVSDFFSERIPLTPGAHVLRRNFRLYKSNSWGGTTVLQHDLILEKYLLQ